MNEPAPTSPSIRFVVRYGFGEWFAFVRAHLLTVLRERGKVRADAPLPWTVNALMTFIALPLYLYKKLRMPQCRFTIDATGITREAGGRSKTHDWSQVQQVLCYEPGYLVCLAQGAMPIPSRCLNPHQQGLLVHFIAEHLAPRPGEARAAGPSSEARR